MSGYVMSKKPGNVIKPASTNVIYIGRPPLSFTGVLWKTMARLHPNIVRNNPLRCRKTVGKGNILNGESPNSYPNIVHKCPNLTINNK